MVTFAYSPKNNPKEAMVRLIVISCLPEPQASAIDALRRKIGARADAAEALRYPPHITLRTGLVCPDDQAESVARDFLARAAERAPFMVGAESVIAADYLDGGGARRGLLAYRIACSPELLALHHHLLTYTAWQKGPQGPFEPHLSLCYQDVTPDAVRQLDEEFNDEVRRLLPVWRLDRVELWHQADAGWIPFAGTGLKGTPPPGRGVRL